MCWPGSWSVQSSPTNKRSAKTVSSSFGRARRHHSSPLATRCTEQLLLDLIGHAQSDLFLVSFVAYDVSSVVDALNAACSRGIDIRILLETSTSHGGSLSLDPIAMMRRCVPSAALYVWTDRPAPFAEGGVHAKVAVADGSSAFLISAKPRPPRAPRRIIRSAVRR
ncbi:phospholipase D-like domain-containing protein [Gemmobacter nanjingensis]|uniref:phospholipase D-like domain-containing protein n=1 Tax=Gemmobacter nanjingensis TaxID=488454 RepID=UPI0038992AAA